MWVNIAAVITLLVLATKPVLDIYKNWSRNAKEGVVNNLEANLYRQLSEQLTQHMLAFQQASREKNDLFQQSVLMEARLEHLESNEAKYRLTIQSMEARLSATEGDMRELIRKNEELSVCVAEKNLIIHNQHLEIRALIEKIIPLELQLASQEDRHG